MTPTNTPTSKCCEECSFIFRNGSHAPEDWTAGCGQTDCPCHTPTTDSKNSSEKCCLDCATRWVAGKKIPCDRTCTNCHTTDKGWELAKLTDVYEREGLLGIQKLIQHIAKEEYERGKAEMAKITMVEIERMYPEFLARDCNDLLIQLSGKINLAALETPKKNV